MSVGAKTYICNHELYPSNFMYYAYLHIILHYSPIFMPKEIRLVKYDSNQCV